MGSLTLPIQGLIALDSAILIYAVERHPLYAPIVSPLWRSAQHGTAILLVSELALSEALVMPLRD